MMSTGTARAVHLQALAGVKNAATGLSQLLAADPRAEGLLTAGLAFTYLDKRAKRIEERLETAFAKAKELHAADQAYNEQIEKELEELGELTADIIMSCYTMESALEQLPAYARFTLFPVTWHLRRSIRHLVSTSQRVLSKLGRAKEPQADKDSYTEEQRAADEKCLRRLAEEPTEWVSGSEYFMEQVKRINSK